MSRAVLTAVNILPQASYDELVDMSTVIFGNRAFIMRSDVTGFQAIYYMSSNPVTDRLIIHFHSMPSCALKVMHYCLAQITGDSDDEETVPGLESIDNAGNTENTENNQNVDNAENK